MLDADTVLYMVMQAWRRATSWVGFYHPCLACIAHRALLFPSKFE